MLSTPVSGSDGIAPILIPGWIDTKGLGNFPVNFFMERFGIAEKNTLGATHTGTGRLLTLVKPLDAQIALHSHFSGIIKLHGTEGAGIDTFPASDAQVRVDENDTLGVALNGLDGAGFDTGGVRTVVTVNGIEVRCFFNHPHQPGADTQAVLLLARHFAGMTSHTVFTMKG
jgi:hypothetical protein